MQDQVALKALRLEQLVRAQAVFERFRKGMVTDRDEAGAIQAFEFCFELAWKTMQKLLFARGLEVVSPRETFRKAALEGIIKDSMPWFVFLEKRDLSAHTYNQEYMIDIVQSFDDFSYHLQQLILGSISKRFK